jgi:hypothetical protein
MPEFQVIRTTAQGGYYYETLYFSDGRFTAKPPVQRRTKILLWLFLFSSLIGNFKNSEWVLENCLMLRPHYNNIEGVLGVLKSELYHSIKDNTYWAISEKKDLSVLARKLQPEQNHLKSGYSFFKQGKKDPS